MKAVLEKIGKLWWKLEDCISVFGMVGFGVLIMIQIVVRAFGFTGITWLEEFSRYMFIISTFIGCSQAVKNNEHMVMDMLYNVLPARVGQLLQCIVHLMMALFAAVLTKGAWDYMFKLRKVGTMAETMANFPKWVLWIPLTICLATMTIRYLINVYKSFDNFLHAKRYNIVTDKEN